MPFTDRIWNFVKCHRRKFFVAGALTGGVVLLYRYTRRKMHEWEENEMAECFNRLKREQHFESTQKTCKATIIGLMTNLRDRIMTACDCEAITEVLKNKPTNKLELWEELKFLTFARLVAGTYGCCLLVTVLNIQLSIIGGYMFVDAAMSRSPLDVIAAESLSNSQASMQMQQKYLSLIEYFMGSGFDMLIEEVLNSAEKCLKKVPLAKSCKITNLQEFLNAIRADFEHGVKKECSLGLFMFAIPQEDQISSSSNDIFYNRLLAETRDLFESDECKQVLALTVDSAFSFFLDVIAGCITSDPQIQEEGFLNPNDVSIPLAILMAKISASTQSMFGDRSDELVSRLFYSEPQKTLGANVYEAFSHDQTAMNDFRNHNILLQT